MSMVIDKKSPLTGGALELRTEQDSLEYRGETITYIKSFYHCVDTGFEFEDAELENANLKIIYDTYRKRHGIPLAEDLILMRKRYGLPASAMSIILGLGENQYSLYEDGAVPTVSVGNLLALAMDPKNMESLLHSAKTRFTEKQYYKYWHSFENAIQTNKTYKSFFADYFENDKEDINEYPANTIRMNAKHTPDRSDAYNKPALNYAI